MSQDHFQQQHHPHDDATAITAAKEQLLCHWEDEARMARAVARECPSCPEACYLLARALGRCRLLSGRGLDWERRALSVRKALRAGEVLLDEIDDLEECLEDLGWYVQVWPERTPGWSSHLVGRRVDVLAVQSVLEEVLIGGDSEVPEEHEVLAEELVDDLQEYVIDLDTAFYERLPLMKEKGQASAVLACHREHIDEEYRRGAWWLQPHVIGDAAASSSPPSPNAA